MLVGSSALPTEMARPRQMAMAVAGWGFDLVSWEVDALARKARALVERPAQGLAAEESVKLVSDYLALAHRAGELEAALHRQAANGDGMAGGGEAQELAELREQMEAVRPTVEQLIEGQVGWVLAEQGFGVGSYPAPPIQFAFADPPKKLVVSPRDRIETIYSRMLDGQIPLEQIKNSEAAVEQLPNASAYITEIGGLGAYPTMVIDQAGLAWVLSTVVHEWVHNYLVFFPLGWFYFSSGDMTTLNETVADIVGDEVGARVYGLYYPELAAQDAAARAEAETGEASEITAEDSLVITEDVFDFGVEMRVTRQEVDRLLAEGKVAEAETYMAQRREEFVDAGYPLRVLNQAYFAFHGSYGTSAASSSPIGPKLEYLRSLMPDVATFLQTVRWFTSVEDLERSISEWEARAEGSRDGGQP